MKSEQLVSWLPYALAPQQNATHPNKRPVLVCAAASCRAAVLGTWLGIVIQQRVLRDSFHLVLFGYDNHRDPNRDPLADQASSHEEEEGSAPVLPLFFPSNAFIIVNMFMEEI